MEKSLVKDDKFYRLPHKGMLSGVCAGIADSYSINPALIRIILILLVLSGIFPVIFAYFCSHLCFAKKRVPDDIYQFWNR